MPRLPRLRPFSPRPLSSGTLWERPGPGGRRGGSGSSGVSCRFQLRSELPLTSPPSRPVGAGSGETGQKQRGDEGTAWATCSRQGGTGRRGWWVRGQRGVWRGCTRGGWRGAPSGPGTWNAAPSVSEPRGLPDTRRVPGRANEGAREEATKNREATGWGHKDQRGRRVVRSAQQGEFNYKTAQKREH